MKTGVINRRSGSPLGGRPRMTARHQGLDVREVFQKGVSIMGHSLRILIEGGSGADTLVSLKSGMSCGDAIRRIKGGTSRVSVLISGGTANLDRVYGRSRHSARRPEAPVGNLLAAMPRKPAHPCSHPCCPELTHGRFCKRHTREENARYE